MSLTKEKCKKYKKELEFALDHIGTRLDDNSMIDAISLGIVGFEKLINEHFDNPPLKFEDLKQNMWVWDNKIKEYRKIDIVNKKYRGIEYHNTYGWFIEFEENRFFRYEVKNNG